jgi:hypothetical protein
VWPVPQVDFSFATVLRSVRGAQFGSGSLGKRCCLLGFAAARFFIGLRRQLVVLLPLVFNPSQVVLLRWCHPVPTS